ncbi:MAG TPA: hypothetical protein VFG42_19740 [Baekduia sp.]|uniref:hypothetical protein n=1 Tax=Baekduia sp. TaxID=2600305 RepID=UPI002D7A2453|nr:hypothetical protein [Baekduia sp.]HET6509036.1 hypothetical protein [Baekduia sp.]
MTAFTTANDSAGAVYEAAELARRYGARLTVAAGREQPLFMTLVPEGVLAAEDLWHHLTTSLRAAIDELPDDVSVRWSLDDVSLRSAVVSAMRRETYDVLVIPRSAVRRRWLRRLDIEVRAV